MILIETDIVLKRIQQDCKCEKMICYNGIVLIRCSFIIAVDYFQARYPGTTVIFDMSVVYIIMSFFAVVANNILVETLSLNTRITFGKYINGIEPKLNAPSNDYNKIDNDNLLYCLMKESKLQDTW